MSIGSTAKGKDFGKFFLKCKVLFYFSLPGQGLPFTATIILSANLADQGISPNPPIALWSAHCPLRWTQGLLCSGRPGNPDAQRQAAVARGHAPDGKRTSDADPDLTTRPGCSPRGVSNVRSLAAVELSSNIFAKNTLWMHWLNTPLCLTIPTARFPTRPGQRWTPNCARLKQIWVGSVEQSGARAPDHARVQSRLRQTGWEDLGRLAASVAVGQASNRGAAAGSGPGSDRQTSGQVGAGTQAPDQLDQNGGIPGGERSAATGRAALSAGGR
jgi:hypothetical protein